MVAWVRICSMSDRDGVEQIGLLGVVAMIDLVAVANRPQIRVGHAGQDAQK